MEIIKYLNEEGKEIQAPEKNDVIWSPQPKQALMMSRAEYEALYGGAAGGGKTDYLIIEALRQVHIPHYKGLILRRTYPELTEIIDKSQMYYLQIYPDAVYNATEHYWKFPSGAKIYFGSMHREKDKRKYQGIAYDFIGFDELTHFTSSQYDFLKSRNRPNGPGTLVYVRATANPGGEGHGWVKKRFVAAGEPGKPIVDVLRIHTPSGIEYKARSRVYIPASVFDNKKLMENDPNYTATLAALPEAQRKALLYGDWDSFSGQVFTEFRDNPEGYDTHKWTHVIHPFMIPDYWQIWRAYDFGYAKPFSVGWYAISPDDVIYRINEYYGCTNEPNTGIMLDPGEQAKNIKEIEHTDPILSRHKEIFGVADPAIWDKSRGESIAEIMEREGIFFNHGDNARIAGKMQYHYRFRFDENGKAGMYIFNNCKEFIRTIPNLVYDERHVEDINTTQEDHIYDECRYLLMEHPITLPQTSQKPIPSFDPLNMYRDYGNNAKNGVYNMI